MIRPLLVLKGNLVRGALAYVLSAQNDVEVIGERDDITDIELIIRSGRPDVTVIDLNAAGEDDLVIARVVTLCRALVLVEPRRAASLTDVMTKDATRSEERRVGKDMRLRGRKSEQK